MSILAAIALGSGAFLLAERELGTKASATVAGCEPSGRNSWRCLGSWVVAGHDVSGAINGANPDDIGHTLDVIAFGRDAYTTRGLQLPVFPLALIGLGLIPAAAAVRLWRTRSTPAPDVEDSAGNV
jgi:hypothetical protein